MKFKAANIYYGVVLVLSFCLAESAYSKPSKQAIEGVLKLTVEKIVRPRLSIFFEKANTLEETLQTLCVNPSAVNLNNSRAAFKRVAIAWGGIEYFRTGPVLENNRLERILFYPDRKSTGLKQVQRRLVKKDVTLTDLKLLQTKSVAVQGFGAIEFLLFGTGADILETTNGSFRCKFAKTASANVAAIAFELQNSWRFGSDYSHSWMNAGAPNSVFANEQEAINELLGALVHGLGALRDIRIGSFLKKETVFDRPKSALFWRSKMTIRMLEANLTMLENLMEDGGLYSLVKSDNNGTINSLRFEFAQVHKALASIDRPIVEALQNEEQRKNIVYLKSGLGYLIERIDGEFALMLGLSSGFSFSDGD